MKRQVLLLTAIALVFAVFVPVMAQDDAAEVAIAPVACDEPGALTMWVWDENWATAIQQGIDAWEAEYCPGAEIELVQQPWGNYWDTVQTNAAGGELPDVFNMSQDRIRFYVENEALLNLQPYFDAAEVDDELWSPGFVGPYRSGDELYAAPVNWDTIAIYYNKDLFDAAGLEYPADDWTWDDFAAAAAALTDEANDVFGAAVYSEYQAGYTNWINATDTSPVVDAAHTTCTLQEPGSIEALTFLKDLYDQGYMPSVSILGGSSADDAFNYWAAGRVAMINGGSWKLPQALSDIEFNWDVVRLPRHPETGISRPIVHSVGYVAAANTDVPDLAANLIIYLASDEGQAFFAEAGGVAPANPGLQQQWVDSFGETDVNIQAFIDALEDTQGVTAFGEIWNVGNTELVVNLFDLGLSVEEATQQACEAIAPELLQ